MWMNGWWNLFAGMWLFPLIFLIAVLLFIFRVNAFPGCAGHHARKSEPTAREILDRRYARGELGREEYQKMKHDLEQS